MSDFQSRMDPWLLDCFGPALARDPHERNLRFAEEALELLQSLSLSRESAHAMVDLVWSRPAGDPAQEVGGAVMTLAALCQAHGLPMQTLAEAELTRVSDPATTARIRAKQAQKPRIPG